MLARYAHTGEAHVTPAERDAHRLERRRRGEPTLPLSFELAGLTDAEAADRIARAAAVEAEWWRRRPASAVGKSRRRLLTQRVRAEAVAASVTAPLTASPRRMARPRCPWCGRACAAYSPACLEHDELERGFLQAAGDGWG